MMYSYEYIIHFFIVNMNIYVEIFQTQSMFKNIFFINIFIGKIDLYKK